MPAYSLFSAVYGQNYGHRTGKYTDFKGKTDEFSYSDII